MGEREKSLIQFLPRDARKKERNCKTDPEQYLTDLTLQLQYPELIHYHKGVIKLSPPPLGYVLFPRRPLHGQPTFQILWRGSGEMIKISPFRVTPTHICHFFSFPFHFGMGGRALWARRLPNPEAFKGGERNTPAAAATLSLFRICQEIKDGE